MNQTTGIILISIQGAGLLITIGFGIAAYKAYKKSKTFVNETKAKFDNAVSEFETFATRLRGLVS